MDESQLKGKQGVTGQNTFEYPSDTVFVPRGVNIPDVSGIQPADEFRAKAWGSITPDSIKTPPVVGAKLDQDTWIKERARGQQNGFRASETTQYGYEDPPVSNVQVNIQSQAQISAKVYNINTASYLAGHAELPSDLGRDLGSDRVLQRAPGDLLITKNRTYDNQTIVCPGGRAAGYQARQFY